MNLTLCFIFTLWLRIVACTYIFSCSTYVISINGEKEDYESPSLLLKPRNIKIFNLEYRFCVTLADSTFLWTITGQTQSERSNCESQPPKGHLTSKLKYRRFPSYRLCTLVLFPFHLLPSYQIFPLFFPWLPCHFYLVVIEQQQQNNTTTLPTAPQEATFFLFASYKQTIFI